MTQLSPVARTLVSDALTNRRDHVIPLGSMNNKVVKNIAPLPSLRHSHLPDDTDHLKMGIARLNAEIDLAKKMIVNLRLDQYLGSRRNGDLIETLTAQRRRALLMARTRGRKSATVADSANESAAQVIVRLQSQINDLKSGFETVRAALDDAGAPPALGLHMRVKAQAIELDSWKKRALQAEAYERRRTRESAHTEQRQRAGASGL